MDTNEQFPAATPKPGILLWWVATTLNAAAIVIGFRLNWYPSDMALNHAALAAAALMVIAVLSLSRFRLSWSRGPKLSLAPGFHLLLLMIGMHALSDQTLLDRSFGLWAGAVGGLVLGALVLLIDRPVTWVAMPVIVVLLAFASWSCVQIVNYRLDDSAGRAIRAKISDKSSFTNRSGSVDYTLFLTPPAGYPEHLAVKRSLYEVVDKGQDLCLTEHPGRFGARWFEFDRCREGK